MVYRAISAPKLVDQLALMACTLGSLDPLNKSRPGSHAHRNRKLPNSPSCPNSPACRHFSSSAVIDIVVLIVVLGALGFLLYPYAKLVIGKSIVMIGAISYAMMDEIYDAPLIYGSIGLSVFFAGLATWALVMCTTRRCGNPDCLGLRKAAEFDIQLETEECVKNSSAPNGSNQCLLELPIDHHRELEAELKKMAPLNGRAVLVFRARCGCSIGRLEVPGPKRLRKIKK